MVSEAWSKEVGSVALQNMLSNSVISASISWNNINVYSKSNSSFDFWKSKTKNETHIIKNGKIGNIDSDVN